MKEANLRFTKNTDVTESNLQCTCGLELDIIHVSNWHDDSGIFYCTCQCGKERNVRWHYNPFLTPTTYQIEKETIWGESLISKRYYSFAQALRAFTMMNIAKYGDNAIFWLVHFEGDQRLGKQRIERKETA